ncbi:4-amino-4-deoxy-L-arabinose transferase-like glycosyltransferase [Nocardia tenerifensis]|uniref:4-amino-4-deoxy-L-arabinose transferase-like glycosyltransferase n=1 Tax=Nocardia tenerifensis TaxID=228006 RepID=A0A318JJV5_9NOCA|nr:glycosyltransferase family 39 protein [Nocardia tenerifensis]PXX52168.1 4-amino-4-deoxy-L-arabinose transferase-like glycosyltransferase [Nocardia tenerifensis]
MIARADAVADRSGVESAAGPPRFATLPVAVIAAVTGFILIARSTRYDYFGDELYFLAAGRRPAAGYVDQGPLIPSVARAVDVLAPDSLVALRLPSIVLTVGGVVVAAALAREFGGRAGAQSLASLAYAVCPFAITQAATLSTFAFDATLSATVLWLVVAWVRARRDGVLLAAAAVAAVDLQVKLLVPVVLAGIVLGAAVFGPRRSTRRRTPLLVALIVAVAAAPSLAWQAAHGWPQVAMGRVIRAEQSAATGGALGLPVQFALLAGLLGTVLTVCGLWGLLRRPSLAEYRFLTVVALVLVGFVVLSGGRPYYLAALLPVLFAAGAVTAQDAVRRGWRRGGEMALAAVSLAIALGVIMALPQPISRLHEPTSSPRELYTRLRLFGTTGWPELLTAVSGAYAQLDPAERGRTVIVTQTYWQAAAIDQLGAHLPPVYSPNRGFAYFGTPPDSATTVLYVTAGDAEPVLRPMFSSLRVLSRADDPLGFPGISRSVTVWRGDDPTRSWSEIWSARTTLALDTGR